MKSITFKLSFLTLICLTATSAVAQEPFNPPAGVSSTQISVWGVVRNDSGATVSGLEMGICFRPRFQKSGIGAIDCETFTTDAYGQFRFGFAAKALSAASPQLVPDVISVVVQNNPLTSGRYLAPGIRFIPGGLEEDWPHPDFEKVQMNIWPALYAGRGQYLWPLDDGQFRKIKMDEYTQDMNLEIEVLKTPL